ncbi:MAG: IS110 family transposase [Tetragenococcus koreensis]|nr:IS110 family transposase [Tetragenococcus koreensis]
MEFKEIVGIDVSKKTLDIHIHKEKMHGKYDNSPKDIKKMGEWVFSNTEYAKDEVLFVFEHTGMYSYQLSATLSELGMMYVVVPGLEIKRSLGIARGKSDKADAAKIALYGYRLREELEPSQMPSEDLQSLRHLLRLRDRFVRQRAGFKTSLKEEKRVFKKKNNEVLFETQERSIKDLSKKIKKVEKAMDEIIRENQELEEIYKLIISIKGVGSQTALYMIAYTQGFTKFENWRKFASYCGIAPFPNSSGTSVRGKTKVSNLANKKIKSLFDMCAKTALQYNPEIKQYYKRRVEEQGKNKMSTINVIRNKLLSRIFAVVERGTPYVDTLKYAA